MSFISMKKLKVHVEDNVIESLSGTDNQAWISLKMLSEARLSKHQQIKRADGTLFGGRIMTLVFKSNSKSKRVLAFETHMMRQVNVEPTFSDDEVLNIYDNIIICLKRNARYEIN